MTFKIRENSLRIISFFIVAIYLFPAAKVYTYAPYIIIGLLFVYCLIRNKCKIATTDTFAIFTLYAFFVNFIVTGYSLSESLTSSLFLFVPFMVFHIGLYTFKVDPEFKLWKIAFVLIIIEVLVCLIQYLGGNVGATLTSLYGSEKYVSVYQVFGRSQRCIGTLGNPNTCSVCVVALSAIVLNKSNNSKIRVAIIVAMTFIAIVTKSRTSIICEISVIVVYYANLFKSNMSMIRKIFGIIIVLVMGATVYFLFEKYVSRDISVDSLLPRIDIWNNLIQLLNENSVLYHFFGNGVSKVKSIGAVDNEYLFVFLSCGWLGLCIWLGSIIKLIWRVLLIANQEDKQISMSMIIIWLISAITMGFFFSYLVSFIPFIFIGFTTNQMHRYQHEV